MNTKLLLDNYLGKNTRVSEKDMGDGTKQVCDLDTGDCYTVRMKDGLIERVDKKSCQFSCFYSKRRSHFLCPVLYSSNLFNL